jgi:hypothetical protein
VIEIDITVIANVGIDISRHHGAGLKWFDPELDAAPVGVF